MNSITRATGASSGISRRDSSLFASIKNGLNVARICAGALVALAGALPLGGAETGLARIAGEVIDGSNGLVLRGAAISVEGTSLSAVSDLQGSFVLNNVPAGPQV